MEKNFVITSVELAHSHGFREGETFAVCYVREDVKDDNDILAGLGVFEHPTLPYVINISTFTGANEDEKCKDAVSKLVGKSSRFNVVEITVEELTNGLHKGYKVDVDGESVEVTKRTLIGKSSDDDLIARERASLNKRETDTDHPITWF